MQLFQLLGEIAIENQNAIQQLDETANSASNTAESMNNATKSSTSFGDGLAKVGTVAAGTVAVAGAVIGGLSAWATQAAETTDNIDKMSQKLGISREAYQEWDYVLSQNGASIDSMQASFKTMTTKLDDITEKGSTAKTAFERLGFAYEDLAGKSSEDVFAMTISALQDMDDETARTAIATDLLGKSATELAPLLNQSAESTEALKDKAHELGLVLSDEAVDSGVELTDTIDTMKRSFSSVAINLASSFMPIITKLFDYIIQYMPQIQEMVQKIEPVITTLFESLLPPLMDLAEQIFPVVVDLISTLLPPLANIVGQVLPIIVSIIQILIPPLMTIVSKILPIFVKLINALLPIFEPILKLLSPLLDLILVLLEPLFSIIDAILPPIIDLIVMVVDVIVDLLVPIINTIADLFENTLGAALSWLGELFGYIFSDIIKWFQSFEDSGTGTMEKIWDTIKTVWENISTFFKNTFETIKNIFTKACTAYWTTVFTIFNKIKTGISTAMNAIKTTISNILNAVKNTFTNVFNGIKTFITNIVDKIKNIFKFEWELPKIKLPHFSVEPSGWQIGDLLKGSIPSLGVEWYAKGGILENPTAFGVNGNNLMVGGEAGAEAVAPIDVLQGYVAEAVASQNGQMVEVLNMILQAILGLDDALVSKMVEALQSMRFDIQQREFARLVKAVN